MAEVEIKEARMLATLAPKSGAYGKRGSLLGYNSGWVLADSDAAAKYFAQWIALEDFVGDGSKTIRVAKEAIITDADAPYTAVTTQYLSGTAGATTETRPADTGANLAQVVGRSLDDSTIHMELKDPVEFENYWIPYFDGTGEAGVGTEDTGFYGPQIDGNEVVGIPFFLPSGCTEVLIADLIFNSINASGMDFDVTVVGCPAGGATHTAGNDTGTAITTGDADQADADNQIFTMDVTDALDSGFVRPGTVCALKLDPDGITADAQCLGLRIVGLKV